jgi:hypothetical protein
MMKRLMLRRIASMLYCLIGLLLHRFIASSLVCFIALLLIASVAQLCWRPYETIMFQRVSIGCAMILKSAR